LDLFNFFYGFLGEKIVLIYYTNGGVRYWIHSNYLAFLNKNKNGLYILRVWFLEVCPPDGLFVWLFLESWPSDQSVVEHLSQSDRSPVLTPTYTHHPP